MSATRRNDPERRILVLAPTRKDGDLTRAMLARAGIECHCCRDLDEVCRLLDVGAGAVLVAEEAVAVGQANRLGEWLSRQPAWSDLPVLVLARTGADSAELARAMDLLGNVTVLERPTRVASLVSAARAALRARQKQYQIRDHFAELEQAQAALRDADRRKDEFLAMLAHELRNPLAPIRNSLHILRLSSREPTEQRVGEMMERQVNHMVRLVDDLMEVSRITRGKIELRKELVEVAAVVRSAVETSRPSMEAAGHQFALTIPSEPLMLEGDPVRLTQAIANLLNNAAKYTDPGGQIWLTIHREDTSVAISVRDSGMGIPPDLLPRVFDLFMQVDRNANRAQGGLGIGLTLVKNLVELHGGTVQARSEGAGRGSEFVIRLPLKAGTASTGIRRPDGLPGAIAPRRVMVVDDNRDAAESLGMLLKLLGADVRVVYSGADALDALATFEPAVILLDIGMPGMDGHEVARRIRERPECQGVTLIALTGWGQEEDRRRSETAGFDFHLIKPANVSDLESLLTSLRNRP